MGNVSMTRAGKLINEGCEALESIDHGNWTYSCKYLAAFCPITCKCKLLGSRTSFCPKSCTEPGSSNVEGLDFVRSMTQKRHNITEDILSIEKLWQHLNRQKSGDEDDEDDAEDEIAKMKHEARGGKGG